MQIHKAKQAGVKDQPYDAVTPEARARERQHKLSREQREAFTEMLTHLTMEQLAVLYNTCSDDQKEFILDECETRH